MKRTEVPQKYRWDLTALVKDDAAFEAGMKEVLGMLPEFDKYKDGMRIGTLRKMRARGSTQARRAIKSTTQNGRRIRLPLTCA